MKKHLSKTISFVFPTFGNMLWMAAFCGILIFGRRLMNADGDLALHLSLGRYILNTGKIPLQDVFSHTMAGQPVTQHEWLATVLIVYAQRILGFQGVILLCAVVIATSFWLVYNHARIESQTLLAPVFVTVLVMITSMMHWLARPHIFTFLLLACWMMVLDQMRRGELGYWWFLPAMMIAWVNLHGGFFVGLITWAIYGLGQAWDELSCQVSEEEGIPKPFWRYYLLSGVTAFFITLLNPHGVGLWKTIISHLGNKYLADLTLEFQSPNFHWISLWPALIFITLLMLVLGFSSRKMPSGPLFNITAWLVLGLYSARNIPLFAIISAPYIVWGIEDIFLVPAERFKLFRWIKSLDIRNHKIDYQLKGYFLPAFSIAVVVIGFFTGFHFHSEGYTYAFDPDVFPVEAVNWLEEHPQEGEMFNYFTWGGYLQYRLWPEKRVFIDSKSDFYGEEFLRQYMLVINSQTGWQDVLEKYHVAWAILPVNEVAAYSIQSDLGWPVIYKDNTAVILKKEGPS